MACAGTVRWPHRSAQSASITDPRRTGCLDRPAHRLVNPHGTWLSGQDVQRVHVGLPVQYGLGLARRRKQLCRRKLAMDEGDAARQQRPAGSGLGQRAPPCNDRAIEFGTGCISRSRWTTCDVIGVELLLDLQIAIASSRDLPETGVPGMTLERSDWKAASNRSRWYLGNGRGPTRLISPRITRLDLRQLV